MKEEYDPNQRKEDARKINHCPEAHQKNAVIKQSQTLCHSKQAGIPLEYTQMVTFPFHRLF